jgi:SAM-dependent methyltransferase
MRQAGVPVARLRLTLGLQPLSERWGSDRGQAICRYYLEGFLEEFSSDISGHCLEFADAGYVTKYGGRGVDKIDVLHLDASNARATIVADLTKPNTIPSDTFDCIICTHVLHHIYDLSAAVGDLYRILKPGGVLLAAVPHVSMCAPEWPELWRFTSQGLQMVLARRFADADITVRAYGNSLTAAGQIRGLAAHEFTRSELAFSDPRFAVEVCARAVKMGLTAG